MTAQGNAQLQTIEDCIRFALKGNEDAVSCFMLLRDVLHFWDDLIDKDREITDEQINRSMFKAIVSLPSNPFFRQYQDYLLPTLVNAIGNWHAANKFEKTDDGKLLEVAFVIRSDYANLLIQSAYIVGGHDWMVYVTPLIRSMWTSENFSAYMANLQEERAARGKGKEHVL